VTSGTNPSHFWLGVGVGVGDGTGVGTGGVGAGGVGAGTGPSVMTTSAQLAHTWLVWHIDLIHNTENIGSRLSCKCCQISLSELSELRLKHGSGCASVGCRALLVVGGCLGVRARRSIRSQETRLRLASTREAIVTRTTWNWVHLPLLAIFLPEDLAGNGDVGMTGIIEVNGAGTVDKGKMVRLEAPFNFLRGPTAKF